MHYYEKFIVNFTFSNKIYVLKEGNFGFEALCCKSILNNYFYKIKAI